MPVIIKEIYIRTVVEKRIITDTEVPEEIFRNLESRVLERLSEKDRSGQPVGHRRKRNER